MLQKDGKIFLDEFYKQYEKFTWMIYGLKFDISEMTDIIKIGYENSTGHNYDLVSFDGTHFKFVDGYDDEYEFGADELPIDWVIDTFIRLAEAEEEFNVSIIEEK